MSSPSSVASRIRRSVRPWVAGVAAAAAFNVELLTGAPPDPPRRPAARIAWVVRKTARRDGLDDREVIPGRVSLVIALDLDGDDPRRSNTCPSIGPN